MTQAAIDWYQGKMTDQQLLDYACEQSTSLLITRAAVVSTLRSLRASRKIIYRARKILCDPALR